MTNEIDLIIKLRDAGQLIADACNEYLEKQAPKEEPVIKEPNSFPWENGEGAKGPYQSVKDDGSDLFRNFKAILQQNKGSFSDKTWDHYYWLGSQDEVMIFRRRKKRSQ